MIKEGQLGLLPIVTVTGLGNISQALPGSPFLVWKPCWDVWVHSHTGTPSTAPGGSAWLGTAREGFANPLSLEWGLVLSLYEMCVFIIPPLAST